MDTTTTVVDAARRALGPVGAFLPVTFTDTCLLYTSRATEQFAFDYRDALSCFSQPAREWGPGLTCTHDDRIEMRCHQL